ncbi:hypothetical protein BVRB_6g156060 [Beta vulgaris subsp. vulgaris]|uniref:Uncharacterized protein n=1 Tax=Beta vulgaris subsp. vulgaris TaxID=3555 RepID=A0A0J8E2N5_BETVV|nr:hypothetical protein BVRB_6g156060 [Beta vulgaris subsp. vulgaris]
MVSHHSLVTERNPTETSCNSGQVPPVEDGSPRRPNEPCPSSHSERFGHRKLLQSSRNHADMVDNPDGKGVQLHTSTMGLGVHLRPRTRSSPRAKSSINYKELAHRASSKRNRQRQMAASHETVQPVDPKVCMGDIQRRRENVGCEGEDKFRNNLQHLSKPDGCSVNIDPSSDHGGNPLPTTH